jgi:hypothetical protein
MAESAVAGDATALAHLLSVGPLMDEAAIDGYRKSLWVIMHRMGDEAFAKTLEQQPPDVRSDVQKGWSDPPVTSPFFNPAAYMKLHFPKSCDILFH